MCILNQYLIVLYNDINEYCFICIIGDENLPNNLMENLKKLLDQTPMSDIESSEDEEEYLEYIYRPRKYFLVGLCNVSTPSLPPKKITTKLNN